MSLYMPLDYCRNIPVQAYQNGLPISYTAGSVSQQFTGVVLDTLSRIPPQLLEIVANRGFILILSRTLSEVHPEQKFQKPRGHSQSTKGDDLNGLCCIEQRHVHITEFTQFNKATDTVETLRHELGHAVDSSIGAYIGFGNRNLSLTFDFNQVYLSDVAEMGPQAQTTLAYYIQKSSPAGRSEAFAEGVASLLGGGCQNSGYFRQQFPRVVSWIEGNVFGRLNIPTIQSGMLWG